MALGVAAALAAAAVALVEDGNGMAEGAVLAVEVVAVEVVGGEGEVVVVVARIGGRPRAANQEHQGGQKGRDIPK